MKRNNRNMSMPKDGKMYSDLWSQMNNRERYKYINKQINILFLIIKYHYKYKNNKTHFEMLEYIKNYKYRSTDIEQNIG